MTIGDNIKKYRKEAKLTQKGLGDLIDKSTISIRKYEANNIAPSIRTVEDIAKVLNITTSELINGTLLNCSLCKGKDEELKILEEENYKLRKKIQNLLNFIENM